MTAPVEPAETKASDSPSPACLTPIAIDESGFWRSDAMGESLERILSGVCTTCRRSPTELDG